MSNIGPIIIEQLNPIVLDILKQRGLKDKKSIEKFLYPTLNDLHNPFLLKDMDRAVNRIKDAISRKEKVLIFGDYDVDGISATAILVKYFASKNFYVDYYLPNRYVDGYGLTIETIDKIINIYNPNLIITVDCGISCYNEVEYAKQKNIEIIISDHHDIPEVIPQTIVVNPKLSNQQYPFKELCGTGVALKIVQALGGIDEAKKYLSICALATIADIVTLTDENRAIVKIGLSMFDSTLPIGLKLLLRENKLNPSNVLASDIAFKIAPKINASGRMGDAVVGLRLYLEENKKILLDTIETLNNYNFNRQELCNKIFDEAVQRLKKINISNYFSIVLSSSQWDSGVLGIVAAKLANMYNRPTILFSQEGELLKGSARSINNIDIHSIITDVKEVVEAFGGHKMAAGLTIKYKNYKKFINSVNYKLIHKYKPQDFVPVDENYITIEPTAVDYSLYKDLCVLEPFGIGNEKPVFRIKSDKVNVSTMPKYPNHLTINSNNLSIIAFNSSQYLPLLKNTVEQNIDIELQLNTFKNKNIVKGIAKKISTGYITKQNDDFLYGQYIKQLCFNTKNDVKYKVYKNEDINLLLKDTYKNPYGYLFISNTNKSYSEFIKKSSNVFYNDYLTLSHYSGLNTIILAPYSTENFSTFNKIVFLDPVLDSGYIDKIINETKAVVYIPQTNNFNTNHIFNNLNLNREEFAKYFRMISVLASKKIMFYNDIDIFKQLKNHFPDTKLNYKQFVFCFYVFQELGIFNLEYDDEYVLIKENDKIISNLKNSPLYNKISLLKTVVTNDKD